MATLPDRAREVLVLPDILGYRHAEIGSLLDADGHWRVREAALEALAELDDGRAISAVTSMLEDGHGRVRIAAAETLAELEED